MHIQKKGKVKVYNLVDFYRETLTCNYLQDQEVDYRQLKLEVQHHTNSLFSPRQTGMGSSYGALHMYLSQDLLLFPKF